ncbi:MAG: T9SS type A sorting domain-containing protein [Candidatus Cloacimonetes bacterium]|nr:T9SS type A sorting domain-containing protein [Candidatus Cloacimonadota bacterium]MCF7814897.1 T9SS type A sorting domain-containing protein [Candidatus Cloacimonadota bacterium]MCF7869308.1 T9SS type A sorting domain-containing protein [Candidatus Cloacimonadota bacterium]MCF7884612.1 T9SS type A sorting domain-containing protein [Candidatus Cloacimonadota bacterium]
MKKIFIVFILVCFSILSARPLDLPDSRELSVEQIFESGQIKVNVTNYGYMGKLDNSYGLKWPSGSEADYLYQAGLWFGAKRIRRNELGEKLYWIEEEPTSWDDCIPASDPTWTPDMQLVVDTLTTVGFDGDAHLFEFLPAYNPLEADDLGMQYFENSPYDIIAKKVGNAPDFDDDGDGLVDEDDLGSPFDFNDPSGEYLFTEPYDDDLDGILDEDCSYPGFVTAVSYFYDYSPFGTEGERDWGGSSSGNNHGDYEQLNVAVAQEIYTWPVQFYADMLIIKNTLYNTSQIDTLFDCSVGYMVDADIGYDSLDDISTYLAGSGNEFAYSYDEDGDNGFAPGNIALKILNSANYEHDCWYWNRGDGPDDGNPLNVCPSGVTSNEKYWLMTGRNPNSSKYISLRDEPNSQIGNPDDTRFLYAIFGDQQAFSNPSPATLNIPPGESFVFYTLITLDSELAGLQNKVQLAEDFLASGFDYSLISDLPSIPYLSSVEPIFNTDSAILHWLMLTEPDEFQIYYKKADAPASTWQNEVADPSLNEYIISGLESSFEYKFKIGCLFDDVYLESYAKYVDIMGNLYDVWPGDCNNDGFVDADDIIPIGLYWNETGTARDSLSYVWQSWDYPTDWIEYAAFADCNGDGQVNISDVAAICLNWNYSHDVMTTNWNYPDINAFEDQFYQLYNNLDDSGIESMLKNRIAEEFNFPAANLPNSSILYQNYPNPFNPDTTISFELLEAGEAELLIFNSKGQLVKKLLESNLNKGFHEYVWNGKNSSDHLVPSGIYFYQLKLSSQKIATCKMLLLK